MVQRGFGALLWQAWPGEGDQKSPQLSQPASMLPSASNANSRSAGARKAIRAPDRICLIIPNPSATVPADFYHNLFGGAAGAEAAGSGSRRNTGFQNPALQPATIQ
jgi:hypothetical protein